MRKVFFLSAILLVTNTNVIASAIERQYVPFGGRTTKSNSNRLAKYSTENNKQPELSLEAREEIKKTTEQLDEILQKIKKQTVVESKEN